MIRYRLHDPVDFTSYSISVIDVIELIENSFTPLNIILLYTSIRFTNNSSVEALLIVNNPI